MRDVLKWQRRDGIVYAFQGLGIVVMYLSWAAYFPTFSSVYGPLLLYASCASLLFFTCLPPSIQHELTTIKSELTKPFTAPASAPALRSATADRPWESRPLRICWQRVAFLS